MYETIIAILIVIVLGVISLSGIIANYFHEVQQIDRLEIEYWQRMAENARQFEARVAKRTKNGIRKVSLVFLPEEKRS
ncbi:MAG: hypothetical protein GX749_01650 [Ruminococcaceae bacterium]|nr:hypothetical protein [Oscillospiraceae bacterium]